MLGKVLLKGYHTQLKDNVNFVRALSIAYYYIIIIYLMLTINNNNDNNNNNNNNNDN